VLFAYSPKLVERIIKYFKEKKHIEISEETANEYLNSLADLFLAFNRRNGKATPKPLEGLGGALPDAGVRNTRYTL